MLVFYKMADDELITMNNNSVDEVKFQVHVPKESRFNKVFAKEIINKVLVEELAGKIYDDDKARDLCDKVVHSLNSAYKESAQITDNGESLYKLIFQVTLGGQRNAGIRIASRCKWDAEYDAAVWSSYENDSLFCVAVIFAICVY